MLDVDGTLVNYQSSDNPFPKLPSERVTRAIKKAQEKITVCVATGRPYGKLLPIFDQLGLSGYAITNDGAQVIDIATKEILYQQLLNQADLKEIVRILQEKNIEFSITNDDTDTLYSPENVYLKPMNIYADELLSPEEMDNLTDSLSHLSAIVIHRTRHGVSRKYGFLISHGNSTKQHGIFEVAKLLGIETHEIIGVGDGYNDFPLLMACGLKVAMGNANEDLKEIADYIAPSVEDDGVATVIEKFILNEKI